MDGLEPQILDTALSLVIPAFNEEAVIAQAIAEADAALAKLVADYEILIVDDGSKDETAAIVAAAARTNPRVKLLRHATNRGYGAALRTGFGAARFGLISFTDADCQFDLADLRRLIQQTDRHAVVVGRRTDRQDTGSRKFLSWGYNRLSRALLGIRVRDCDCALKVFRRAALDDLLPSSPGFFVNTEMLTRARQLGRRVAEVDVRHRPRRSGTSKVGLREVPRTFTTLLRFWWSSVAFPRAFAGNDGSGPDRNWLLVALFAAMLCFTHLNCPLQEPEEPRYAEISRQMLNSGSYLVPVLNGQPYLDKPPLLYWLVMGSYQVFGISDASAHLVPSAAIFLTILVTYWWGRSTAGARAALAGALVLCLSARFLYLGRLLTMNGLLCLFITATLATGHVALLTGRMRWWLISATACALGILTKGPVALLLALVPLALLQFLDVRIIRPRMRHWLAYLALLLALSVPWYVWVAAQIPSFLEYFLWRHNLVRFFEPFDHEAPLWFYAPQLLLGMLPWTLLLPSFLKFLRRRTGRLAAQRQAALGMFLLSGIWCVFFFTVSGSKRAGYILPAMPPLALALGCYLDVLMGSVAMGRLRPLLSPIALHLAGRLRGGVLLLSIGVALAAMAGKVLDPVVGSVLCGVVFLAWVTLGLRREESPGRAWALTVAASFVLLFAAVQLALPSYARRFSLRGSIRPVAERTDRDQLPVYSYPRHWDSVSFYLRRDDVHVYGVQDRKRLVADLLLQDQALLIVKTEEHLNVIVRELSALQEFVAVGRQGNVTVGIVRDRAQAGDSVAMAKKP